MAQTVLFNAMVFTGIARLDNSAVVFEDGHISEVLSDKRFKSRTWPASTQCLDIEGMYLFPGLIDTHIHGIHGHGTEDAQAEEVEAMAQALLQYGVTSFCPTMYPSPEDHFIKSIKACVEAGKHNFGANMLGMHLEGPFISPEKLGVQRPETLKAVDLDLMRRFYEASEGNIAIMTVAPEIKHMRDLALYCSKFGTVLSAGHTDAQYEHMLEGMQAGILHSTHCFNAMRGLHHRNPGAVGAILLHSNVSTEIIPDGFHVHPALITLLLRSKPADRIIMVSDALKPTGLRQGDLIANGEAVYLNTDGVFQRKSDDCIAGSSLTLNKGIKNLQAWGIGLEQGVQMASTNPADLLSQARKRGYILPQAQADLVVFDKNLDAKMTWVGGRLVYDSFRHPKPSMQVADYEVPGI